jgi:hypothetical protein
VMLNGSRVTVIVQKTAQCHTDHGMWHISTSENEITDACSRG